MFILLLKFLPFKQRTNEAIADWLIEIQTHLVKKIINSKMYFAGKKWDLKLAPYFVGIATPAKPALSFSPDRPCIYSEANWVSLDLPYNSLSNRIHVLAQLIGVVCSTNQPNSHSLSELLRTK